MQNQKFPFHFLSAPPTPPAEGKKKGKENFWFLLPRPKGADEARRVRFTTQSERTMQYRATTHAERANQSGSCSKNVRAELCNSTRKAAACPVAPPKADGIGEPHHSKPQKNPLKTSARTIFCRSRKEKFSYNSLQGAAFAAP